MAEKVRIGIVGANVDNGSWGARTHLPALKSLPEYEIKAVGTRHRDTAEAAAKAFGAELAFDDLDTMFAHPDIDLISVCVRVPYHHEIVMRALAAKKHVYCEWPLGANTHEAEEMASLAKQNGVRSMVGVQARGEPALTHLRHLVNEGYIGDLVSVNVNFFPGGILERSSDRMWQTDPALGGNSLTIPFGHTIDAMCFAVGDYAEVSATLATQVKQWRAVDTGEMFDVHSPDTIFVSGTLENGATASCTVASVPFSPGGWRMEVYGRDGYLIASNGQAAQTNLNQLVGARKGEALAEVKVPDNLVLVPEGMPKGTPYNVGQMYVRLADSITSGGDGSDIADADFDRAVKLHRMLDAIRQSASENRAVKVS